MPKFKIALWMMCLAAASGVLLAAGSRQDEYDLRAPFALELPEVSQARSNEPKIVVKHTTSFPAQTHLRTIKLWVRDPDDSIDYLAINTFINGEAADTASTKKPTLDGKIVELNLDKFGRLRLKPDKNVVEIIALDRRKRNYYASFVLLSENRALGNEAALATPEKFTGRKFAVIIGVSDYEHNDAGLTDLNYADDDAEAIRKLLRSPEGGQFAEDQIRCLVDKQATNATVRTQLTSFLSKAGPQDLIYLFIAGHGFPDPYNLREFYFALHDSKIADLPNTALKMTELQQILKGQKAKRVVAFIDTCHSAGVSGKKIVAARGQRVENNLVNLYAEKYFREEGWALLTSSDVDESSFEDEKWDKHGVFTWALLQGLGGKADANSDRSITAGELFAFVSKRVSEETQGKQNPRALPGSNEKLTLAAVAKK